MALKAGGGREKNLTPAAKNQRLLNQASNVPIKRGGHMSGKEPPEMRLEEEKYQRRFHKIRWNVSIRVPPRIKWVSPELNLVNVLTREVIFSLLSIKVQQLAERSKNSICTSKAVDLAGMGNMIRGGPSV